MANQTNAANPSAIRPFAALCNFEVPTTDLNPDFVPSVWFHAGEFETLDEAKAACYSFSDHPALIAMYVSQDLRVGDEA